MVGNVVKCSGEFRLCRFDAGAEERRVLGCLGRGDAEAGVSVGGSAYRGGWRDGGCWCVGVRSGLYGCEFNKLSHYVGCSADICGEQ